MSGVWQGQSAGEVVWTLVGELGLAGRRVEQLAAPCIWAVVCDIIRIVHCGTHCVCVCVVGLSEVRYMNIVCISLSLRITHDFVY